MTVGGGVRQVEIATLEQHSIAQRRRSLNEDAVRHYMEATGVEPIVVFENSDNGELVLADGHHRTEAARRQGRTHVTAEVRPGDRIDAADTHFPANFTTGDA
jgi:hypothetical protein